MCTHAGCVVGEVSGGTINCRCHSGKFGPMDGSERPGPLPRRGSPKALRLPRASHMCADGMAVCCSEDAWNSFLPARAPGRPTTTQLLRRGPAGIDCAAPWPELLRVLHRTQGRVGRGSGR
ncbi:Rieske 2Fe-2S domain-containing protein [Streptomyces tubercidicus]|uniref:Rieske 2Fe-2S domain-containing protein n=1 Tax=Streptomyces tubercidicus TaxID=47759 RepID=UPI003F5B0974